MFSYCPVFFSTFGHLLSKDKNFFLVDFSETSFDEHNSGGFNKYCARLLGCINGRLSEVGEGQGESCITIDRYSMNVSELYEL